MAEAFSNSVSRAVGIVTSNAAGVVGVTTTIITGISTVDVSVNDLVDNQHFIQGTQVSAIGAGQVTVNRTSTNTASASSQSVKILGMTTSYSSVAKSILIGGTFANNTTSQVNLWVAMYDNSVTTQVGIAQKIPVPSGSSFVIADTGKTLLEASEEIIVFSDTANAIDVSLSILTGVN